MAELSLEPYTARLVWCLKEAQSLADWRDLLAALLDELAIACSTSKSHVIGHIKALALLPGGGYLRGSKVSTGYPADVETHSTQHSHSGAKSAPSVGSDGFSRPGAAEAATTNAQHAQSNPDVGSDGFSRPVADEAATTNADRAPDDSDEGFTELDMTLNLLVYGLPLASAKSIVEETSASVAARWAAELEIS